MKNQKLKDVMTRNPVVLDRNETIAAAAKIMRDRNIGAVVVEDGGNGMCGIVTDRDIVVRCIAQGGDASSPLSNLCSGDVAQLGPDDSVSDAVKLMTEKAVRRIPVVDNGKIAGIVSIGDLAQASGEKSALAGISAAPPNY